MAQPPRGPRRARRAPARDPRQRRAPGEAGRPAVYATCSLLREENEDQAEAFLAAAPGFLAAIPLRSAWAETIGGDCPGGGDYLRLTPARHGTDGFFVAIFERKRKSEKQSI